MVQQKMVSSIVVPKQTVRGGDAVLLCTLVWTVFSCLASIDACGGLCIHACDPAVPSHRHIETSMHLDLARSSLGPPPEVLLVSKSMSCPVRVSDAVEPP